MVMFGLSISLSTNLIDVGNPAIHKLIGSFDQKTDLYMIVLLTPGEQFGNETRFVVKFSVYPMCILPYFL